MAKQLMIYDNIQPISEKHFKCALEVGNFSFISTVNSVPLLATEIPFAAAEYPVIFSPTAVEGEYLPLAVMGLKDGQNLLVNDLGQISARYVPGFIRRYPFVFGGAPDSDVMTLCIDEDSPMLVKDGSKGTRLFTDDGEQTEFLKEVLEFLKDYQRRSEITREFTKHLHTLNLLEPMTANITFKDNEAANVNVTGFFVVSREKLKAIPDDAALDLFKRDGLDLIYAHLYSLGNLNRLMDLMSKQLATK